MKKDPATSTPVDREYLDKRLNEAFAKQDARIDEAFAKQDARMEEALRVQSMQIFQYLQEFRAEMNDRFDRELDGTKKQLNTAQNTMDHLVGEYDVLVSENAADASAHRRFGDTLDDHETRIKRLESPRLLKKRAA